MPWPWSASDAPSSKEERSPEVSSPSPSGSWERALNTQYTWAQTAAISAASIGGWLAVVRVYKRFLRRVPSVNYLSPASFSGRTLYGYVTRVGDGDNFHLFHAPGGRLMGWGWLPGRKVSALTGKQLQGNTVHVRIAGVDAPEMAHFGRPAQPYGKEALDWLKGYVEGRWVRATPYRRDQFDRVVCSVTKRRLFFFKSDVGLAMIRSGVATVYEAKTGSEFGGREEQYRAAEAKAKRKKIGMWAQGGLMGRIFGGKEPVETPRQFKTRQRQEDENTTKNAGGITGSVASSAAGVASTVVSKAASAAKSAVTDTTQSSASTKSGEGRKGGKAK